MTAETKAQATTLRKEDDVLVTIRYKDLEKTIHGKPDAVLKELSGFLTTIIPSLNLASKITLNVDLTELLAECEGVLAITPEDVVVLKGLEKLTDRELVVLNLVRSKIANFAGKVPTDAASSAKIVEAVKKSSGTVAGRLSELSNEGLVERVGKGEYRITTFGLKRFREEVLPKMKTGT